MNKSNFDRSMEIVEDALRSLPLAPAPGPLRSRVMQRVRLLTAKPRFVFPWLEGAISLMVSTLLTGMAYLLIATPPGTMMRLEQSVRLFFIHPAYRPVIAAVIPGLGMLAVCLLLTAKLLRPRSRTGVRIVAVR